MNTAPTPSSGNDWLSAPDLSPAQTTARTSVANPARSRWGKVTAVFAAGLIAGGGVAVAATHDSGTAAAAAASQGNAAARGLPGAPNGAGGGQAQGGFGGGIDGEQHLEGILTSVGGSSVTVKTSSGTGTYQVNGTTQIVRDGQDATLSDLAVGDTVQVHVYPSSSGGDMLVERIFAGTVPSSGGLGGGAMNSSAPNSAGLTGTATT